MLIYQLTMISFLCAFIFLFAREISHLEVWKTLFDYLFKMSIGVFVVMFILLFLISAGVDIIGKNYFVAG